MNETSDSNTLPAIDKGSFTCPHCSSIAQQHWNESSGYVSKLNTQELFIALDEGGFKFSRCEACKQHSVWQGEKMIYPLKSSMPPPNEDMPKSAKEIYEEARQVEPFSSRAAAALLRVCLEKITEELGETTGKLNTRIGKLKTKGVSETVIKGLDAVRIIANEGGSHAGQIDLGGADNKDIVFKLFKLVNYIVNQTISSEKEVNVVYKSISEDKKVAIQKRDQDSN